MTPDITRSSASTISETTVAVARARRIQFPVGPFHGRAVHGCWAAVKVADTIRFFKEIEQTRRAPEQAFFNVGAIEEAQEKAEKP